MRNEQKRSAPVTAVLTPAERRRIKAQANKEGRTVSGLIRQLIREYLGK